MRVVVVAEAVDEMLSVAAREGDFDGVVLASTPGAELVAAVAQVVSGHAVFPAGWLRKVHQSAAWNPLAQLSPRQREVLHLLSLGMDNDQIAERLYISRNTVKFHVRTIYRAPRGSQPRGGVPRALGRRPGRGPPRGLRPTRPARGAPGRACQILCSAGRDRQRVRAAASRHRHLDAAVGLAPWSA